MHLCARKQGGARSGIHILCVNACLEMCTSQQKLQRHIAARFIAARE